MEHHRKLSSRIFNILLLIIVIYTLMIVGVVADTPPIFYQMFNNEGVDLTEKHPGIGPIGSVQWAIWSTLNPSRGVYNWENIDARLKAVQNQTVTLVDGTVIPHPVILNIFPYLSSAWGQPAGQDFYDCTPQWVYKEMGNRPTVNGKLVGYKLTGCGYVAVMPAWDSWQWRSAWLDFIKAFGARYNSNPQVVGVVLGIGLDGETQPTKNMHCQWLTIMDTQAPGTKYRFSQIWSDSMVTYKAAFPDKQLWVDNVAGDSGTRKSSSNLAAELGIGLQNSGMTVDIDSHTGYGTWTGQWDPQLWYSMTLSMNLETRMGFGSPETMYWTYLAGLNYHPDVLTVHPDYLSVLDSSLLYWVNSHIGVTLDDTPSVWTVLRDYEFPKVTWGSNSQDGASGKMGDWTFWLVRKDAPGAKTLRTFSVPEHPLYGRQARTTDQASGNDCMVFDVSDGFTRSSYTARLVFVDRGSDTLTLDWGAGKATYYKRATGKWVEWILPLPGYSVLSNIVVNCNQDGDEVIHMLEVIGCSTSPTVTSTARPTVTATMVPTRTPTTTMTPTMTKTMIATPTSTTGPTYGTLSAICDDCLLVYDGEIWRTQLDQVGDGAVLLRVGNKLWACRPGACAWSEIVP